eukprot:scaffold55240_cov58-Phaeocystis_antarctica.AAC.2
MSNRAVLETGANMVSRTKERAREPLSLLTLKYSPWPRRQYVDGGTPLQATFWCSIHAALRRVRRHCRLLCQEPQSSRILRAACARPSAQSLGDARTCVSSYGIRWARS